ncbi:MAG: S9 family peptidase [Gammaproteobacteria bacterium]|nr:S9 family peptidase [Gammaproteobacteria bacterium]
MRSIFLSITVLVSLSLSAEKYERTSDCFDSFPSHQKWVEFVKSKNKGRNIPKAFFSRVVSPEDFEYSKKHFECSYIRYESDGITVLGYLVLPKAGTNTNKQYPVVIYNRGGNRSYGATSFAGLFNYIFPIAKEGFIVIASQYRGLIPNDPQTFGEDEFGGKDVNDVEALFDIIDSIPSADKNNIFMMGHSRGAMMNYLVAKRTSRINAMVSVAGPTDKLGSLDWRPEMENVYKELIPNYAKEKEEQLKKRSIFYWVEKLPEELPILLIHGEKDKRVNVNDSKILAKKLEELKRPNKLVLYTDSDHQLRKYKSEVLKSSVGWFKSYLK